MMVTTGSESGCGQWLGSESGCGQGQCMCTISMRTISIRNIIITMSSYLSVTPSMYNKSGRGFHVPCSLRGAPCEYAKTPSDISDASLIRTQYLSCFPINLVLMSPCMLSNSRCVCVTFPHCSLVFFHSACEGAALLTYSSRSLHRESCTPLYSSGVEVRDP